MQYGFVACTPDRFHQVYLEAFRNETVTSIRNAAVSVSCAELCLATERPKALFETAARGGKLYILNWGNWAIDLKNTLNERIIEAATFNGNLEAVQYTRTLGISWNSYTCSNAARNGHLQLLKWARVNGCPWDK